MHISFDGRPVRLYLTSPAVILIDPLALDGQGTALSALRGATAEQLKDAVSSLSTPLRIGMYDVQDFRAGLFEVRHEHFERVEHDEPDPRVVDVDCGTMVLVDLVKLPEVAAVLTWELYDLALQAPLGDDSLLTSLLADPERPFFAVLGSDEASVFDGDGGYVLKAVTALPA